jgi:hypothetical protein
MKKRSGFQALSTNKVNTGAYLLSPLFTAAFSISVLIFTRCIFLEHQSSNSLAALDTSLFCWSRYFLDLLQARYLITLTSQALAPPEWSLVFLEP